MADLPISGLPNDAAPTRDDLLVNVDGGVTKNVVTGALEDLFDTLEIKTVTGSYNSIASDLGKLLVHDDANPGTVFLPDATTVGAGWMVNIKTTDHELTICPQVGDTIDTSPAGDPVIIPKYASYSVTSDGVTNWYSIADGLNILPLAKQSLGNVASFDMPNRFTVVEISTTVGSLFGRLQVVGDHPNDRIRTGEKVSISNVGSFDIDIKDDSESNTIVTARAGKVVEIALTDDSTTDGTWIVISDGDELPTFTPTSVPFAGGAGDLKEDVGNLSYDNNTTQIMLGSDDNILTQGSSSSYRSTIDSGGAGTYALQGVRYTGANPSPAGMAFYKARGTEALPTTVTGSDTLFTLPIWGYDGTNFKVAASVLAETDGTVTATEMPTNMVLRRQATGDLGNNQAFFTGYANKVNKTHVPLLMQDTGGKLVDFSFDSSTTTPQYMSVNNGGQDANYVAYGTNEGGNPPAAQYFIGSNGTFVAPTSLGIGDDAGAVFFGGYSSVGGANTYFPMMSVEVEAGAAPTAAGISGVTTITSYKSDGNGTTFIQLDGDGEVLNSSVGILIDNGGNPLEDSSIFTVNDLVGENKATIPWTRKSTTSKNLIVNPVKGMVVYDTDLNEPSHYDGTAWISSGDDGFVTIATTQTITGLKTITNDLNIQQGEPDALRMGADVGATTLTDATNKGSGIVAPHYTLAEEDVSVANWSSVAAASTLNIGGGDATKNAVTGINFSAADDNTTLSGTVMYTIDAEPLSTATHLWNAPNGDNLFRIRPDKSLEVLTANYETIVIGNNAVPNKKYVDDADALKVALAGAETITGDKTFTGANSFQNGLRGSGPAAVSAILLGADTGATTVTAAADKQFEVMMQNYTAGGGFGFTSVLVGKATVTNSDLYYGGDATTLTPTAHIFYAGPIVSASHEMFKIDGISAATSAVQFKWGSAAGLALFEMKGDGLLSSKIADYETLVTNDDDIPNKKYVDDKTAFVKTFGPGEFQFLGAGSPGLVRRGTNGYDATLQFRRNQLNEVQMKFILDNRYVSGNDLKVDVVWEQDSLTAPAEVVEFQTNSSFLTNGEATAPAPVIDSGTTVIPNVANQLVTTTFTIDGTSISTGDLVGTQLFRDAGTGSDNYDDDALVSTITFTEVRT